MSLFLILLLPVVLGLAGLYFGKGRIKPIEFVVHEAVILLIVCVPYGIALYSQTADVEIWNGVVASKEKSTQGCCHPYCCQMCQSCSTDSKGNTTCTSYCCQTCYEHSYDVSWDAWSSNNEHIYGDGCNPPYTSEPRRWTAIKIGEPTAYPHNFKNYIKGAPDTLMRRTGQAEPFEKIQMIPPYPQVYDYYRADRFIPVRVNVPNLAALNYRLSEINGKWGAPRKVNIDVVVVQWADENYLEALREAWLGGKINDIVVAVGLHGDQSSIAWAGVISWTKNEQVKVDLRNRILDMQKFDGPQLLDIIEQEVSTKYEHRRISDFQYLEASVTPSTTFKVWLAIIAFVVACALQYFFWTQDPFENTRFGGGYRRF